MAITLISQGQEPNFFCCCDPYFFKLLKNSVPGTKFFEIFDRNKNFNPGMEFWPQSLKSALALKHYQLKCFGKYFDTFGEKN